MCVYTWVQFQHVEDQGDILDSLKSIVCVLGIKLGIMCSGLSKQAPLETTTWLEYRIYADMQKMFQEETPEFAAQQALY